MHNFGCGVVALVVLGFELGDGKEVRVSGESKEGKRDEGEQTWAFDRIECSSWRRHDVDVLVMFARSSLKFSFLRKTGKGTKSTAEKDEGYELCSGKKN